jgi:hypothetical protein
MEESSEEAEEVADALLAEVADRLSIALCFEVRSRSDAKWPLADGCLLAATDAQSKSHAAADHAATVDCFHIRGRCALCSHVGAIVWWKV